MDRMSVNETFACDAYPPERRFAVADVLALPFEHIQDMNDAIVSPVNVENTIENRKRREGGWKPGKKHLAQYSRSKSRIWCYRDIISQKVLPRRYYIQIPTTPAD
jgi:hypothetical protein